MVVSKPAPDELALVQAFVNTRDIEAQTDELADAKSLSNWFSERGLMSKGDKTSARDLAEALEVREAIRSLLLANNGVGNDAKAQGILNKASSAAHFALGFGDEGVTISPQAKGTTGALGRLLAIVADSMADGSWARFKACLNDNCEWAYYDYAKNHSRKWCEMAVCGNRMKARAYRKRQGAEA